MKSNLQVQSTDTKSRLTILWVFVMFNYLYCDVIALMNPDLLKQFYAGKIGGIQVSQGFLLGTSILMEIPIAMVLLSQLLNYRANRWVNILAGTVMTVVQLGSFFIGSAPTMYYTFFSVIEVACTALIVWYAWKWPNPVVQTAK